MVNITRKYYAKTNRSSTLRNYQLERDIGNVDYRESSDASPNQLSEFKVRVPRVPMPFPTKFRHSVSITRSNRETIDGVRKR